MSEGLTFVVLYAEDRGFTSCLPHELQLGNYPLHVDNDNHNYKKSSLII